VSANSSRWESSAPIRYPDPNIVVVDPRFRSLIARARMKRGSAFAKAPWLR
jgi:hypothetical protein